MGFVSWRRPDRRDDELTEEFLDDALDEILDDTPDDFPDEILDVEIEEFCKSPKARAGRSSTSTPRGIFWSRQRGRVGRDRRRRREFFHRRCAGAGRRLRPGVAEVFGVASRARADCRREFFPRRRASARGDRRGFLRGLRAGGATGRDRDFSQSPTRARRSAGRLGRSARLTSSTRSRTATGSFSHAVAREGRRSRARRLLDVVEIVEKREMGTPGTRSAGDVAEPVGAVGRLTP